MYKIWLKGIFEGIFSSKPIIEGRDSWRDFLLEKYNEGISEGIFLLEKYNEGILEGRRNTGLDCKMSQDIGHTMTWLLD